MEEVTLPEQNPIDRRQSPEFTRRTAWTAADLRHAFAYDPETGRFTWLNPPKGRARPGSLAGSLKSHGYVELTYRGQSMYAHHAAWLHVHGVVPAGLIDHINGVRSDNRIVNLRVVDSCQNIWNTKVRANATGTGRQVKGGRFYAHIGHRGKRVYLGTFDTEAEAAAAYRAAAKQLRGEFYV